MSVNASATTTSVPSSSIPRQQHQQDDDNDFNKTFRTIAHHLFPDGCTENNNIHWPKRQSRRIIPYNEALRCIQRLRRVVLARGGLSPNEMILVATAACETLPSSRYDGISVGEGSKLIDGSSSCFVSLIRSMLPRTRTRCDDSEEEVIPACVISMILSATSRCRDSKGKIAVLRFLLLVVRRGCLHIASPTSSSSAKGTLSALYSIPFQMITDVKLVGDAVRLLHALTRRRHVTVYRARRLRQIYDAASEHKNLVDSFSPILLLLQLYARYHPSACGACFPTEKKSMGRRFRVFFQFPNKQWQHDFEQCFDPTLLHSNQLTKQKHTQDNHAHSATVLSLHKTVLLLEDAFDGVRSSSWALLNPCIDSHDKTTARKPIAASDLLMDVSLRQILLLSLHDPQPDETPLDVCQTEILRLRTCLSYMLYEEWNEHCDHNNHDSDQLLHSNTTTNTSFDTKSHKIDLLKALASFTRHANRLPSETEHFILEEVLPSWDGTYPMGEILCQDLIPYLPPMMYTDLHDVLLRPLGQRYIYASPQIKHFIVSSALTSLLRHWALLPWQQLFQPREDHSNSTEPFLLSSFNQSIKDHTLLQLIQWIDNLLLTGLIAEQDNQCDSPLIQMSAIDFIDAACHISSSSKTTVFCPSPSLVYRLLLSSTADSVDRICALLLRYKTVFEGLKQRSSNKLSADSSSSSSHHVVNNDVIGEMYGLERVALFNCFIWDFCSVLWRCSPLPSTSSLSVGEEEHQRSSVEARSYSILFTDISPETLRQFHSIPLDYLKISSCLSITHGAVFSGFASDFLEQQKNRRKDEFIPSPDLLIGKLKVQYLDYLRDLGLHGIYEFLTTFVGSLAERTKRKAQKAVVAKKK